MPWNVVSGITILNLLTTFKPKKELSRNRSGQVTYEDGTGSEVVHVISLTGTSKVPKPTANNYISYNKHL